MKLGQLVFYFVLMSMAWLVSAQASTSSAENPKKQPIPIQSDTSSSDNAPLIPVPEPSSGSLVLLSLGGLGLTLVMRRQA